MATLERIREKLRRIADAMGALWKRSATVRRNAVSGVRPPPAARAYALAAGGLLLFILSVSFLATAPARFPVGERIEIPVGSSLLQSARMLSRADAVRSALFLQILLIARSGEVGVKAGAYQFNEPLSAFAIARAITEGTHATPLRRLTIFEGLRNEEIDMLVSAQFHSIPKGAFIAAAEGKEGYLFPDTYHVPETLTAEQLVALMEETFAEKLAPLEEAIENSERAKSDLVIMASILEREADNGDSLPLVAGILWKRLALGMPLQVDASFSYLLGKTSVEVTQADLALDSPYNTYRYKGLPPTPLNNPGLVAIEAALFPAESPYLYYLTGRDGAFHYARTFTDHKKNKARYLD